MYVINVYPNLAYSSKLTSLFRIPVYFDLHHGTHFGDASKVGDWTKEVLRRLLKIWKCSTVNDYLLVSLCIVAVLVLEWSVFHTYIILIL